MHPERTAVFGPRPFRRNQTTHMSSKHFAVLLGATLGLIALPYLVSGAPKPEPNAEERAFRFDVIGMHEPLEHTFHFENAGQTILQLTNVSVTKPLEFVKATSRIPPGENGSVKVRFGDTRVKGNNEGKVKIAVKK